MLMIKKFEGEKVNFLKFLRRERKKLSAKNFFAESQSDNSRRRILRREFFLLSAKKSFAKSFILRREYYFLLSPKNIALAEASVSRSVATCVQHGFFVLILFSGTSLPWPDVYLLGQ
jgi:hypothetical protein